MGKTKCAYNWNGTGLQAFYDASTFETYKVMGANEFIDDFHGADLVIPATGSDESGCKWTSKIVGAAPPTVAKTADAVNGEIACALTADSQKQDAALHMDDQLTFSLAQGVIWEARVKLSVLPSAAAVIASFGLWGAWGDGGSAYRVGFTAEGDGVIDCESDDNATDTQATSGVTVTTADWKIYRIDATTQSNIKFYIDGARVAASTTFANAASAANAKCQPHFGMYKASGTGVGTMLVDYVKVWQNRA